MERVNSGATYGKNVLGGFVNLLIVVVALVIVYYSFKFFYGSSAQNAVVVMPEKVVANAGVKMFTNQAQLFEGGEYTVNFWIYISGWRTNQGTRKHVLEIGGTNFATLLVGLGAFKNSLFVRVHTRGISGGVGSSASLTGASASSYTAGSSSYTSTPPVLLPASSSEDVSLTATEKDIMFKPMSMDTGLMDEKPMCDIEEVDLQRWLQVSIVLNGRTCDVYLDGKLHRSCVLPSFYKVDPTGISVRALDKGGFDGYMSQLTTYNYALTPDAIYKSYMNGPTGTSLDPWQYFLSLFRSA